MRPNHLAVLLAPLLVAAPILLTSGLADEGHEEEEAEAGEEAMMMEELREQHREHEHGHDFEAMEEMSPDQRSRVMTLMREIGLAVPPMDPARGRKLFVETGCVVCHSVNGVGGEIGPSLNADEMPHPMNAFEFAARMWRGAASMTELQEQVLGGVIDLSGQDLADLIAFAHDAEEQEKLTADQVPERFRSMIE